MGAAVPCAQPKALGSSLTRSPRYAPGERRIRSSRLAAVTTIHDLVKNFQLSEHCTKKGQEGNHWSLNATSKLPLAGNGNGTQYMYAIPSSFSFVCLFLLTMRESALSLETVHICFKN